MTGEIPIPRRRRAPVSGEANLRPLKVFRRVAHWRVATAGPFCSGAKRSGGCIPFQSLRQSRADHRGGLRTLRASRSGSNGRALTRLLRSFESLAIRIFCIPTTTILVSGLDPLRYFS